MDNKKFYWIKLKTDFFNQEAIDFLMSQENGCEYIVLYQMLCLKTANNGGLMSTQIGEMIIPYDAKKIARDSKYFDIDTVIVALELFKKLGLIYEQEDGLLKMSNYHEMIGSESASKDAIKKREYRLRKKLKDNQVDMLVDKKGTNCPTEYRDKSIEYRDKNIDIDKDIDIKEKDISKDISKKKIRNIIPPKLEDVINYCNERNNGIDAQYFIDFYESKDWMIGKNKMKDWKAAVRTWERNDKNRTNTQCNWSGYNEANTKILDNIF